MPKFNETNLRPLFLNDYQGQDKIKKALSFYIKAAKMRGECLDHIIIYGPSGLGKTTLANIIGKEMGQLVISVSAPTLKTVDDLISLLRSVGKDQILFIDEIHRLPKKLEEVLYFAMEDFTVDVTIDGVKEREDLPPFTLIGATTAMGMLSEPLRNRFQITLELTPYNRENLSDIVIESMKKLGGEIGRECAKMIADRSRGIPRIANGFVRRVQDFAMVMNEGKVNTEVVNETFDFLGIDENGLTNQDRRYLETLFYRFGYKSVGIDTICSALNDDKNTIEKTVEPYLIQEGFIAKTPRGRVLTKKAISTIEKWESKTA